MPNIITLGGNTVVNLDQVCHARLYEATTEVVRKPGGKEEQVERPRRVVLYLSSGDIVSAEGVEADGVWLILTDVSRANIRPPDEGSTLKIKYLLGEYGEQM